ncbi:MAG: phosphotransferase [Acidimicrobiales bacterium]
MTADEVPLSDGSPSVSGAKLIAGAVHRTTGAWTDSVHGLLHHLEAVGFDGAPRMTGFDAEGREILEWVEGEAPDYPWPAWMTSEEVLAELAALLRRYHEAVASFVPPANASWRKWLGSPGGPIIRHGDLWPANVVFRHGLPVALIDWDFAQPGTIIDDVSSAAKHWVPLVSDERARADGWRVPFDRRQRLKVLCDAYGLGRESRAELIPTALRNSEYGYLSHKTWGQAGVPGFAEMWRAGSGESILGDRAWLEVARPDLEGFADD